MRPFPHLAQIRAFVMKREELSQLRVLLLLNPVIGRVQLRLTRDQIVTIIDVIVSSLLLLGCVL